MHRLAVYYITAGSKEEAIRISSALLEGKLIACCNIVDKISSVYIWQNKLEQSEQFLMIMKSRECLLPKIIQLVTQIHSYQVPEVIAMPILGASPAYAAWVLENTLQQ